MLGLGHVYMEWALDVFFCFFFVPLFFFFFFVFSVLCFSTSLFH